MMLCYECGQPGHIKAQCPNRQYLGPSNMAGDGRPMWCGTCDERSRHLELADGRVKRCQCHPESHKMLAQHRRCGACRELVVRWDTAPCGQHCRAGVTRAHVELPRQDARRDLTRLAEEQVAESRRQRLIA